MLLPLWNCQFNPYVLLSDTSHCSPPCQIRSLGFTQSTWSSFIHMQFGIVRDMYFSGADSMVVVALMQKRIVLCLLALLVLCLWRIPSSFLLHSLLSSCFLLHHRQQRPGFCVAGVWHVCSVYFSSSFCFSVDLLCVRLGSPFDSCQKAWSHILTKEGLCRVVIVLCHWIISSLAIYWTQWRRFFCRGGDTSMDTYKRNLKTQLSLCLMRQVLSTLAPHK